MLIRLTNKVGETKIYDCSNIAESEAMADFENETGEPVTSSSSFSFDVATISELITWARTGE